MRFSVPVSEVLESEESLSALAKKFLSRMESLMIQGGGPGTEGAANVDERRVEERRGGLGHAATLRFPSPLIERNVPISSTTLSDWLRRRTHGE